VRRPALRLPAAADEVRRWSPLTVALRVTMLVTGIVALAIAPAGRELGPAGVIVAIGLLGLLAAVAHPDGAGPAVVVGAAAVAWTSRYGTAAPPVGTTLVLAIALAVHHQAATLSAALPPAARASRELLARFATHAALVLALSAAVAVLALAVARPGGSVPLELAGLAAAVLATAVPVLLARTRAGPGRPGAD
jgi:hypothetical protein